MSQQANLVAPSDLEQKMMLHLRSRKQIQVELINMSALWIAQTQA